MKNTFVILLYKLFELKIMLQEFYENLSLNDLVRNNFALNNTARILALEEKKHVDLYRQFVKKSEMSAEYIISDDIMGQVDFYLINLKQSISSYGIVTAGQLIAKAIDTQNKQIFLITRTQEGLNKEMLPQFAGEILNSLLMEEQKHLNNLLPFNKI